ncbi:MAG: 5-formyltetrahydrofolate cyclo-ligase [Candidatus Omnitrophica bacterium]|nr:5-formyltetrahydrofolate cyclo-ligase [Candidatus Omnitrophota bacterium]
MLTKEEIRSKILLRLKTQKEDDRDRKSRIIKDKLFRNPVFKKAEIVMFYISIGGEVDTRVMIKEAQELGKIITVPVCEKDRIIKACLLGGRHEFKRGPYGIWEPAIKQSVNLNSLDLVIVPGLAFTKRGQRLGRGRGYYDRFLAMLSNKTRTIGLAFDFQILPYLPTAKTDVNVDKVIYN